MRSSIDVHNHLLAADVVHELSQLPGPLRDLSTAPSVLGLPPLAVGRPTLLADDAGAVVVLAPADAEVDTASVAELLGRALGPVPPDRAPGLTGYLLAFVPPVAWNARPSWWSTSGWPTRTSSTRPPASPA